MMIMILTQIECVVLRMNTLRLITTPVLAPQHYSLPTRCKVISGEAGRRRIENSEFISGIPPDWRT